MEKLSSRYPEIEKLEKTILEEGKKD